MIYTDDDRASDIAAQIALTELVRIALSELCYSPDKVEFRRRAERIESAIISGLYGRTLFPGANEATEKTIKERVALHVTNVMTSIMHPDDAGPQSS
ncbi:hypothetical protein [Mesorhizobium sp. B2-4-8]|uniref:hypothetical protein n=1 Tax=Mesorhizobium sp. B2-4-8 TaxID=2589941 RepID=UPI00112B574C|nr:hypothetical protein [Mesorhizobium sp. B2-4-8]TPL36750.1 hypothetical protein FJ947_10880 [Mesorhizobium sp. B2-4-8]